MRKIFARIGMYLTVTDDEYEALRDEFRGDCDLPLEMCGRFLAQGELSTDSYIPDFVFGDILTEDKGE